MTLSRPVWGRAWTPLLQAAIRESSEVQYRRGVGHFIDWLDNVFRCPLHTAEEIDDALCEYGWWVYENWAGRGKWRLNMALFGVEHFLPSVEKKLHLFEPSPYLFFSIHLDGLKKEHDKSVCQEGVFDRAVKAIKAALDVGHTVNVNATIFDGTSADRVADFLDFCEDSGISGVSISPGYAYERAPDQEHFLSRQKTKQLFRDIFARGQGRKWPISHSSLFLDFLAGNQSYTCTPWGMPTRNIFGWQRPCYLLGEGYAPSFNALMKETEWEKYGTGNYENCADCMAHCGYEPTAAADALAHPFKALAVSIRGVKTEGEMAPEIDLSQQRSAEYIFEKMVENLGQEPAPETRQSETDRSNAA